MLRGLFLLTLLVSHGFSESCVTYTFEDDFYENFTDLGICTGYHFWEVGTYDSIAVTGQNERSSTFITPTNDLSCVSSFFFPITAGGRLEVLVYMEANNLNNQVTVLANQYVANGVDTTLGTAGISPFAPNYADGWHTLVVNLSATQGTSMCYISIMGVTSPNSIVLVDSFRYIPPGMDESVCKLYDDEPETPEETTPDPTTPEETTTDPTTPEETMPENNSRYVLTVETWIKPFLIEEKSTT